MNFHDTKMGRNFFEHQLPQLIKAIQTLAAALDKPAQAVTLPVEADPGSLSSLYCGSYGPTPFRRTQEGKKLVQAVDAAHEELEALLSEEGREKLVKYQDALSRRESVAMQLAFESGFRTAMQMIVAELSQTAQADETDKQKDGR